MTCRPFTSAEAFAAGFLNRVVPAADLDQAVEDLVAQLLSKSSLTLRSTKRHVDAVTRQMVGLDRSWADADSLVSALGDPESRERPRISRKGEEEVTTPIDDVLEDLVAEYDRLESILDSLSDAQWRSESGAPGWTVTDVMIHLAADRGRSSRHNDPAERAEPPGPRGVMLDEWVDRQVVAERDEPEVVFARWKAARRAVGRGPPGRGPRREVCLGAHTPQAPNARHHAARRALGARARRDRTVRHPPSRH